MKKLLILLAIVSLIAFGCTSKKVQISMKPESTTVKGDLSDYFEVVDQEYIVKLQDGKIPPLAKWSIKLRKTENPLPEIGYYDRVQFSLEVVDENGSILDKLGPSDAESEIIKLKPGEEGTLSWFITSMSTEQQAILDATSISFSISSFYEKYIESESSSDVKSNSNANVDALLSQLESMLNQFEKMDDLSDEYDVMEKKILDFMSDIDDCDMTSAQEKRFDKLENRWYNH